MAITVATSSNSTNTASSTVTLPASVAAGDLIIAVIAGDSGAAAFTWPSPWVELDDQADSATAHVASIAYLIASGGETSVSVTHTSERTNQIAWRIPAAEWHGTTPPENTTAAKGSSINPLSSALTPSWGSAATMWFSICTWDDSTTPTLSTYPTNYSTAQANNVASSSAARCAGAERTATTATETPGSFALTGTETWIAWTIGVRPPVSGNNYTQNLSGSLSFSGSITKQTGKPLSGALSFSGAFSKFTSRTLTAAANFAGSLAKRTSRLLPSASLSFSGAFSTSRVTLKTLTASLSFSGSLVKQTGKSLTASMSFSGAFNRATSRTLAAAANFSGALTKRTSRSLAAGLSFSGSLAKRTNKTFTAALSFSGSISKRTSRTFTAAANFAGSITKRTARTLTAAANFAGSLATNKISSGTLYFKTLTASLSFSGSLSSTLSHFRVIDPFTPVRIVKQRFPWYGRGISGRRRR